MRETRDRWISYGLAIWMGKGEADTMSVGQVVVPPKNFLSLCSNFQKFLTISK